MTERTGIARLLGTSLIVLAASAAAQQEPRPESPSEVVEGMPAGSCAAPEMVRIPGGTFTQGVPAAEPSSSGSERPQRRVLVSAFEVGRYEVTFAEWDVCVDAGGCDHRPGDFGWGRGDRPVINVTWHHARLYVEWLSSCTGDRYRLLTESEWEYAARAGTRTPFHTGGTITPRQANFDGRYEYLGGNFNEGGLNRGQTVPVGSFAPNGFGLHDMHGNVWEWVQDCWNHGYVGAPTDGSAWETAGCRTRVLRSGSWLSSPRNLRSASRQGNSAGNLNNYVGFRVARTPTP